MAKRTQQGDDPGQLHVPTAADIRVTALPGEQLPALDPAVQADTLNQLTALIGTRIGLAVSALRAEIADLERKVEAGHPSQTDVETRALALAAAREHVRKTIRSGGATMETPQRVILEMQVASFLLGER